MQSTQVSGVRTKRSNKVKESKSGSTARCTKVTGGAIKQMVGDA